MLNIKVTKVKRYSFEGTVNEQELTQEMKNVLQLTKEDEGLEIKVEGDFSVDASYDDAYVESIDGVALIGKQNATKYGPTGKMLETKDENGLTCYKMEYGEVPVHLFLSLKENEYNLDNIADQIQDKGDVCEWIQDYNERMADYYHDSLKDR